MIYEDDPDRAPDDAFVPGTLRHLVAGNTGRLLDARRTPVTIAGVDVATGQFDLRIGAFEDSGAVWRLPFEDAGRFQFGHDAALADEDALRALEQAARRFDRPLDVAAELGLAPYHGKVVRDPATFDGGWSKERRAEHLLVRLALTRQLWSGAGVARVELFRGAAGGGTRRRARPSTFLSATFSRAVAEEHFAGGPRARWAELATSRVPVERLLMTFWETAALNEPYAEAEAVMLGPTF